MSVVTAAATGVYRAIGISLLIMATQVAAGPPDPPEQVIEDVTAKMRHFLDRREATDSFEPSSNRRAIIELVAPHFNFERLTRETMGDYWADISGGERRCLTAGLRERLIDRYTEYLLDFHYTSIETQPTPPIARAQSAYVTQRVTTASPEPLLLGFKLDFDGGAWKVTDLSVDGVSLVKSHAASFAEDIEREGIGDFLRSFPPCRER